MPGELIRTLIIGHPDPGLAPAVRLQNVPDIWADGFDMTNFWGQSKNCQKPGWISISNVLAVADVVDWQL
jgi:hypothetical protein